MNTNSFSLQGYYPLGLVDFLSNPIKTETKHFLVLGHYWTNKRIKTIKHMPITITKVFMKKMHAFTYVYLFGMFLIITVVRPSLNSPASSIAFSFIMKRGAPRFLFICLFGFFFFLLLLFFFCCSYI